MERIGGNVEEPKWDEGVEFEGNEQLVFGQTRDGATVRERKDGSHFHAEGGLTKELLSAALATIDTVVDPNDKDRAVRREVKFDRPIGKTTCVEVGPDDQVVMVYRNYRKGLTPMVKNREPAPSDTLSIVLREDEDRPGGKDYILATAYIGEKAPREPWDESIESEEERRRCEEFWKTHALIYNDGLIDQERMKKAS